MKYKTAGVTLLEIVMAMLILALVTGGIFTAFVFSRRVNWRTEGELLAQNYSAQVAEDLRLAVAGASPSGLRLAAGVWVDDKLANAGAFAGQNPPFIPPPGADVPRDGAGNPINPNPLNFPAEFAARYQTNPGTAANWTQHGDGRIIVVEGFSDVDGNGTATIAENDLDGDGQVGFDFDGDRATDMHRVRVKVQWATPQP